MKKKPWFSLSHIRTGILTTVLGLALIVISLYFLIAPEYSAMEGIAIMILGLALLGIDDPRSGSAVPLMLLLLFSSCVSFEKCQQKFGTADTVRVNVETRIPVVTTVTVPGDTVFKSINIDSMLLAEFGDTLQIVSSKGRAQISFWKDQYNNLLQVQAECLAQTITDTVFQTVKVPVDCPTVVFDSNTDRRWHVRLWEGFKQVAAYLVLGSLAVLLFMRLFKL